MSGVLVRSRRVFGARGNEVFRIVACESGFGELGGVMARGEKPPLVHVRGKAHLGPSDIDRCLYDHLLPTKVRLSGPELSRIEDSPLKVGERVRREDTERRTTRCQP